MTQALYRRYRPQTFADVIGQEHVTAPLQHALTDGRIGHAYLFSGPRGCGKTTSARILARCLNCEQGPTATPCGECPSCVALARGGPGSVDVIEIDAASHGGVEDARDLREKASYGPANSRYRVYIIDEAHMVTPQGFNALLKIVEEPPEHVKFIFATTEPEKVIGTIRSRTHHYPFRLVPPAQLQAYLERVCEQEGVQVEPGVLSFVVRAGGGSVRDSLSVLDQLMAGAGGFITYAGAAALLGFTEGELLDATVDAIAARDGAAVFRQIEKVIETGHDPRRFIEDLLERFRDLIVVAAVGASGSAGEEGLAAVLRGQPSDQIERLRNQAAAFGAGELSRAADVTNAGLAAMTGATAPRLQLELLCARLLLPRMAGEEGVIARVDRLERRLEMGGAPPPRVGEGGSRPGTSPAAPVAAPRHTPEASGPAVPGEPVSREESASARPESRRPTAETPAPVSPPEQAGHAGIDGTERPTLAQRAPQAEEDTAGPAVGEARLTERAADRSLPAGIDTDAIRRAWPDVLAAIFGIRRATWTFLSQHSQVLDFDGRRLLLGISSRGLARTFSNGNHAEVVRQALIDTRGIDTRVEGIAMEDRGQSDDAGPRDGPSGGPSRNTPPGSAADPNPPPAFGPGPSPRREESPRSEHRREGRSQSGQQRNGSQWGDAKRPSSRETAAAPREQREVRGEARASEAGSRDDRHGAALTQPGRGEDEIAAPRTAPASMPPGYPDHIISEPPAYDEGPGDPFAPPGYGMGGRREQAAAAPHNVRPSDSATPAPPASAGQAETPGRGADGAPSEPPRQQNRPDPQQDRQGLAEGGSAGPALQAEARDEEERPTVDTPIGEVERPHLADTGRVEQQPEIDATPNRRPQASPTPPALHPAPSRRPAPEFPAAAPESARRHSVSGHEAFRAAMAARRARAMGGNGPAEESAAGSADTGTANASTQAVGDADIGVSVDDEDISDAGQVGQPVIADVLGGVVIAEAEE